MTGAPKPARLPVIDIARGLAILAMIVYHFAWDLGFLQFTTLDVTAHPGWIAFQRLIVSSFLFLVGVGLVLGHGRGIRWPTVWRRFALIAGAALLVTIGTYIALPESFVYFGILHAIALFSLMGLAFLRLPAILVAILGILCLALPLVVQSAFFSPRPFSWIGLWDIPPLTEDLVPVFPWFGMVLLGIAATRLALARGWDAVLARIKADNIFGKLLVWMGRWSLVIYLVHQPILLGALYPLAMVIQPGAATQAALYLQSCQSTCEGSAGEERYCTAYCACTLDEVETRQLWPLLEAPERTEADAEVINELANQCAASAIENLQAP